MGISKALKRISLDLGVDSVWLAGRDLKLLILLRMIRMFAYGGTTLILVMFLSALGFPDASIGLFLTLTLVGGMVISSVLTVLGDRMGVRVTMSVASILMMGAGVAFAVVENYWWLLLASVLGVINPSANEVDPFKAIEESAIARLSSSANCNDFFAWWTLLGMVGMAASTLITGFFVDTLQQGYELTALKAYRTIFLGYALVGFLKLLCSLCTTSTIELGVGSALITNHEVESADDRRPLLPERPENMYHTLSDTIPDDTEKEAPIFTPESCTFIWKASLAIFPDYMGSGLAHITWMTYFFKQEYDIAQGSLGLAIFVASIVSSFLNLLSSPMSRALGQVPTMVICHTVTSVSLLMIAAPSNRGLAIGLFMFRIVLRELDAAPRQAFMAGGVLDEERTSAMGVFTVMKTAGACAGLFLTGQFAGKGLFWVAFLTAGFLKLVHNIFIVGFFWNHWGRYEA